jgi:hypothetical protein
MPAALSRPTADLQLPLDLVMSVSATPLPRLLVYLPIVCLHSLICFCMCLDLLIVVPSCNQNHGLSSNLFYLSLPVWPSLMSAAGHFEDRQSQQLCCLLSTRPESRCRWSPPSFWSTLYCLVKLQYSESCFRSFLEGSSYGQELSQDQRQAMIDSLFPFASLFPGYRRHIYTAHSSSHWHWRFQTHHFISASCFGRREWFNQWTHRWHALARHHSRSELPMKFPGSLCHQERWLSSFLCWLQEPERCYYTRWLPTSENRRHYALFSTMMNWNSTIWWTGWIWSWGKPSLSVDRRTCERPSA